MRIAIGADHAGFVLKEHIRQKLQAEGHEVIDFGTSSQESTDYPDYALQVSRQVAQERADRGILVCATGIGMSIAANKVDGVRAAAVTSSEAARLTREHNDANVLALGAKLVDETQSDELVDVFLNTEFSGGRHARRVAKIARIERMGGEGNES
jgi:ribose 5-phosphate isomerase B